MHHPSVCAAGRKQRLRCHNSVLATLRRHLERKGAFVDIERHVPELYVVQEGTVHESICLITNPTVYET